ncbi:MAG: hypothetical protein QXL15_00980 [Candidatus Korarchaeota archaeon]
MGILEKVGSSEEEFPHGVRILLSIPDVLSVGSKIIDEIGKKQGHLIAEYTSKHLPPIVMIQNNEVRFPTIRFWKVRIENEEFLAVSGDDQPMSTQGMFEIGYAISKKLLDIKPKEIIVIGTIITEGEKEGSINVIENGKRGPSGEILGLNGMIPAILYEMSALKYKIITVSLKNPAIVTVEEEEIMNKFLHEIEKIIGGRIPIQIHNHNEEVEQILHS